MKRTELKRGSGLRRKTPLAAGSGPQRKPVARKAPRRKASSDTRWRSEAYLAFVRSLPCCVCGATTGIAAHHMIGMWQLGGMGLKAPDSFAMPACDGPGDTCHRRIHDEKALRDRQPGFVRDTISRAVRHFEGDIKAELVRTWEYIDQREAA